MNEQEVYKARAELHDYYGAQLAALRAEIERLTTRLFDRGEMDKPPCFVCGYNGAGYYNPDTHPCAAKHHAARASVKGE